MKVGSSMKLGLKSKGYNYASSSRNLESSNERELRLSTMRDRASYTREHESETSKRTRLATMRERELDIQESMKVRHLDKPG